MVKVSRSGRSRTQLAPMRKAWAEGHMRADERLPAFGAVGCRAVGRAFAAGILRRRRLFELSARARGALLRGGDGLPAAGDGGAALGGGEEAADGGEVLLRQPRAVAHGDGVLAEADVGAAALARARHVGDDLAVLQLDDAVGVLFGELAVVRDDDDQLIGGQFLQRVEHLPPRLAVQGARRLVGEDRSAGP